MAQFLLPRIIARFAGQVMDAGGSMGVGHSMGMAMGAQLARPGKQVLATVGDGGLGITGFDLESAARYNMLNRAERATKIKEIKYGAERFY